MKIVYLALGLWLLPGMLWAQSAEKENEFTMSMQIRPRAEYRNGAQFPRFEGDKAAAFINNRARLSMEYKRSDLSMKISAQHVGVWGQDPQIDTNGRFIMNEAWAKLDFGAGFFAQLGRQTLSYDDERILGGLDWNVAGRYHDALKLGYAKNAHQLHFILAFNQNKEKSKGGTYYYDGAQPYKNMQTLWYHYAAQASNLDVSLLFMNLGLETGDAETETSRTRYLQTFGTYVTYQPESGNWLPVQALQFPVMQRKLCSTLGSWLISLKVDSLVAVNRIQSSMAVKVAGSVVLLPKRWGVAKARGATMYSTITLLPRPSIISTRNLPSNSIYSFLQGVPCRATISFLSIE